MKDIKEILKFLRELPKMMGMLNMPTEKVDIVQSIREIVYEWKGYKDLENQGKLLKLPCAVGDTVWYWDKEYDPIEEAPFEGYVSGYEIVSGKTVYIIIVPKKNFIPAWNDNSKYKIEIEDFGKTVFLTKEEAEAALKEL